MAALTDDEFKARYDAMMEREMVQREVEERQRRAETDASMYKLGAFLTYYTVVPLWIVLFFMVALAPVDSIDQQSPKYLGGLVFIAVAWPLCCLAITFNLQC